MATDTSNPTWKSMPGWVLAAPTAEARSYDDLVSEFADEGDLSSTPGSRSPVPEDQELPATVHFKGRAHQLGAPAANPHHNETNDKHNVDRRKTPDERYAQGQGDNIDQEISRTAPKPRVSGRSPTISSPNGRSRRLPEVSAAPRPLGEVTGGISEPPSLRAEQATTQHPAVQTMERRAYFHDMRRTATPRVFENTSGTNIPDGEVSQQAHLAERRVHESPAVASLPPLLAHPPRIRRSARSRRPNITIEDTDERRRTRSPTPITIHQHATSNRKERDNRNSDSGNSPSGYQRCILEDSEKGEQLIQLVRGIIDGDQDGGDKKDLMEIRLAIKIGEFYDTHADRPVGAGAVSEDDLIDIISQYSDKPANNIRKYIVNAIDRAYFQAGWVLKPVRTNQNRSSSALPTPLQEGQNTQTLTPPSKRSSHRSNTGTSRSAKRSRVQSATQSFPSAPSESQTSVSQDTRYLCHCGKKPLLRKWTEHDATHHPLHFFACIHESCDEIFSSRDGVMQHWGKHGINLEDNKELKETQMRNKFLIPDRGHRKCIYEGCPAVFDWDGEKSREHLGWHLHLKQEPLKALANRLQHLCGLDSVSGIDSTDTPCGKRDHWKSSPYVQPENRHRVVIDDTDESGEDGLSRNPRNGRAQETYSARSRGSYHDTSERGEPATPAGGATTAPYISPYKPRVRSADQQSAADGRIEGRINGFLQDGAIYALESSRLPTHPSEEAAEREMDSIITQTMTPFKGVKGM